MQDTNTLTIEKIGTIVFPGSIPSINNFIDATRQHRMAGVKFTKEWVDEGFCRAKNFMAENFPDGFTPLNKGVWLNVKVFRNNLRARDVHNTFIKPILDGFTEAKLWADDNEKVVPKVTFEYCGVDKENPRVEFEIYQEVEN